MFYKSYTWLYGKYLYFQMTMQIILNFALLMGINKTRMIVDDKTSYT